MSELFVPHNGLQLWTTSSGNGTPLILCNGGPGCCDYLAPVASMIDDLAQVIRFEQGGCGRSDPAQSYDVPGCVAELETIRQHYGIEEWLIGGHSWGADLALVYALAHPERVKAVVCIAGGRMVNDREWHKVYEHGRDQIGERQPEFAYPHNLEANRQVNQSFKQYIQRPTLFKELAVFAKPVLFVYGSRDIRPRWPEEQLAHLLPKGEFHLIEEAEHVIWLTHGEELKRVVREFVRQI